MSRSNLNATNLPRQTTRTERTETVKNGSNKWHFVRRVVAVGDKMIDYHEDFRMYLVTRNPDPQVRCVAFKQEEEELVVIVVSATFERRGCDSFVSQFYKWTRPP